MMLVSFFFVCFLKLQHLLKRQLHFPNTSATPLKQHSTLGRTLLKKALFHICLETAESEPHYTVSVKCSVSNKLNLPQVELRVRKRLSTQFTADQEVRAKEVDVWCKNRKESWRNQLLKDSLITSWFLIPCSWPAPMSDCRDTTNKTLTKQDKELVNLVTGSWERAKLCVFIFSFECKCLLLLHKLCAVLPIMWTQVHLLHIHRLHCLCMCVCSVKAAEVTGWKSGRKGVCVERFPL